MAQSTKHGRACGKNALVELYLWMVLGVRVALGRLARRQRQHQGGNLVADIGKILRTAAPGRFSTVEFRRGERAVCAQQVFEIPRDFFRKVFVVDKGGASAPKLTSAPARKASATFCAMAVMRSFR